MKKEKKQSVYDYMVERYVQKTFYLKTDKKKTVVK